MRTWLTFGMFLLAACKFEPQIFSNPDAQMGFKCFATDNPACPPGLVCCAAKGATLYCGDNLLNKYPNDEGWCQPPPPAADTTPKPWLQWDLGVKNTTVAAMDPLLTGTDEGGQWRCPRDDKTPREMQPAEIARRFEPNDTMLEAISYGGRALPLDNIPMNFSSYEVCPDKSAPGNPDVDVFKFRLDSQAKVIAEVQYNVMFGDLDIGLFREGLDQSGEKAPSLIKPDLSTTNNACLSEILQAGTTYYLAVRGAPKEAGEYKAAMNFHMNNYRIRIYALSPGSTMTCPSGVPG